MKTAPEIFKLLECERTGEFITVFQQFADEIVSELNKKIGLGFFVKCVMSTYDVDDKSIEIEISGTGYDFIVSNYPFSGISSKWICFQIQGENYSTNGPQNLLPESSPKEIADTLITFLSPADIVSNLKSVAEPQK